MRFKVHIIFSYHNFYIIQAFYIVLTVSLEVENKKVLLIAMKYFFANLIYSCWLQCSLSFGILYQPFYWRLHEPWFYALIILFCVEHWFYISYNILFQSMSKHGLDYKWMLRLQLMRFHLMPCLAAPWLKFPTYRKNLRIFHPSGSCYRWA